MTPWRLELARMLRTPRVLVVIGVHVFFGLLGPLSIRYLPAILRRFGAGAAVASLPPMGPLDGMAQFTGNAQQLGVLAIVAVAASSLAFDARPGLAAFFRTRAPLRRILPPRLVVPTILGWAGYLLGLAVATGTTVLLLGDLPTAPLAVGAAAFLLYLAFAVAVTATVASRLRSPVAIIGVALGVLVLLGIATVLPTAGEWDPAWLVGAVDRGLASAEVDVPWKAALTAVLLGGAGILWSVSGFARREV